MGYWDDMEQRAPDSKSDADRVAAQLQAETTKAPLRESWEEAARQADLRREHAKRRTEDYSRFMNYDISPVEYRTLFVQQNGVCAICREAGRTAYRGKDLCVDHDHRTGRVRALLCGYCNSAIGFLRESPLLARAAATYLEQQLMKEFTGE
jgi:hypothetical protein